METRKTNSTKPKMSNKAGDQFYSQVIESLHDYAVITADKDLLINSWNSGATNILGYNSHEAIGNHISIIFTEEDKLNNIPEAEYQTALTYGKASDNRWHVRKDGKEFYSFGLGFPLKGQQNENIGFVKVLRDLTEKMQWEEATKKYIVDLEELNNYKERFLNEQDTFLENIRQGIVIVNRDGIIQYSNHKFCKLFEVEYPKAILGTSYLTLVKQHKSLFIDAQGFLDSFEKRQRDKTIVLSEELKLNDGRTFECDHIPIIANGETEKSYWIYRDISEKKQVERDLNKQREHISALLEAIPDLIFLQDRDGVYLEFHAPKGTHLYVPPDGFIGKNMNEILPPDLVDFFSTIFKTAKDTKSIQNFEYSLERKNKELHFESRTVAMNSDLFLSLVRDITDRKDAEIKIQKQNEELMKLNQDKDRFMSILAHDLKSPFNSIIGFLDLLSQNIHKYEKDKIERMIGNIKYSSDKFYHLLEDLLLWARARSGRMLSDPQIIDIQDVCFGIIEELKARANSKNLTISHYHDEKYIMADVEMLKTILRNLVSNAIKFTPKGGEIEINSQMSINSVIVTVADTGMGICPEKLNGLFDFSTSGSTLGTDGEAGTGLGLFLVKEMVERQNGKIWVDSVLEKGTKFKFLLPQ